MSNDDGALMTTEPLAELRVHRPPAAVLAEAREAAQELQALVRAKPDPVIMNGEQYLEYEDWSTVGRFYGCVPRVTESRYVVFDDVRGWEADAELVHVASGVLVSRGQAMCLNDEDKWRTRPKYEYHYVRKSDGALVAEDPGPAELVWEEKNGKRFPKKLRVRVGDEPVPMFQLRSMAETRAGAKVLRLAFAWVVVLAGYKPTPAEELTDAGRAETRPETVITAARTDGAVTVTGVDETSGEKDGRPWTRYMIRFSNGTQGGTFEAGLAKTAEAAKASGKLVIPTLKPKGQFVNLVALVEVNGEAPPNGSISEADVNRLLGTMRSSGWSEEQFDKLLQRYGCAFPQELPADKLEAMLQDVKAGPQGA